MIVQLPWSSLTDEELNQVLSQRGASAREIEQLLMLRRTYAVTPLITEQGQVGATRESMTVEKIDVILHSHSDLMPRIRDYLVVERGNLIRHARSPAAPGSQPPAPR